MQKELLQQILDEIRSMKPVSLIEGRDCVWDDLAQMYASAQKEIRICGEGADLSDPSTEEDILRLGDQTKKILADRKIVTRIQTVDTWASWLDFQRKLREEYRGTYLLYFTDQQLKFVPQLNIKDRDEVSLVSPEQQRELTYSTRIRRLDSGGSQAIQKHLNDFESLQRRSIRLTNPRHLRQFAEVLRKVKRWQTSCFVAYEFHSQKESGLENFNKPAYTSIQGYFPFDRSEFDEFAWDTLNQQYSVYRQGQYPALGSILSILTSDRRFDADELSKRILSEIYLGDHTSKSKELAAFLDEEDIKSASYRLIKCFSRDLFTIFRKISSGPI